MPAVLAFISDSHAGGVYKGLFTLEIIASESSARDEVVEEDGVGLGELGFSTSLLLESRMMLELRRGRKPMGA